MIPFSHIAAIRCEVESYFNVDIKKFEKVKSYYGYNLKKDGLKQQRGVARKYFCYLCRTYLGLTNEEIARYIGFDQCSVSKHFFDLAYPNNEEEEILTILSERLNAIFLMQYKKLTVGG